MGLSSEEEEEEIDPCSSFFSPLLLLGKLRGREGGRVRQGGATGEIRGGPLGVTPVGCNISPNAVVSLVFLAELNKFGGGDPLLLLLLPLLCHVMYGLVFFIAGCALPLLPSLAMTDAGGAVGARSVRPRLEFRKKRTRSEWIKEIAWVQLATG